MSWQFIELGDAATFVNGYAFKPEDWSNKGKEIIRIQNLTKSSSEVNYFKGNIAEKYRVRRGDLLISWSATLGIYEWQGDDAWLNQHIFKVIFDKEDFDKSFFKHLISSLLDRMQAQVHGATMKHITKKKFDAIQIPLPPLPIQKKIAAILDAADAYRQKTKALIEKYDQLTQSLFLEMFGDPVRNEFGFEKTTIRNIVSEVKYGTSAKASDSGCYPYLRMNNITYQGHMDYSSLKYIDVDDRDKEKYIVKKGDILFNRTNSKELVGKTGLIKSDDEMIIAGYLIRVRLKEDMNPYFVWAHLNSKWAKLTLENMCKNIVGMANINAQELQDIPILKPSKKRQDQYAERIIRVEKQKEYSKISLWKAEELFQGLLQRAFKGELIV